MSKPRARVVNVIPNIKIKREEVSPSYEEDDDCVSCKVCNKVFASEMALQNHVRMEHIEVYATGDSDNWMQYVDKKSEVMIKTEQLISSMAPTDLMTLANDDVSYIIIKAEPGMSDATQRKRKLDKDKTEIDKVKSGKDKEVQPITGPFECLQPSTLVADGTCHQIFFSCCEYSIHFRDEHTRRRKGLRCQVCEKPLASNGEEPTAPFTCEVCGAGFQGNKDLSEHMATDHVKLKPFQCVVCQKRFTQQSGVQQHMRMHTGDRPFSCSFCSKAFTQKSGLDQHLRIHTKLRPYRCVVCSKTFCQSVHLKQHMRTHTNVSPFQCGICSKRFKQSSHLNYHLRNHNQVNMTEEQKIEYRKLVSMINEEARSAAVLVDTSSAASPGVGVQVLELEEQELHTEEVQEDTHIQEEEEEEEEGEEILLDEQEQMLAEQSIQQNEEEEVYILGETM